MFGSIILLIVSNICPGRGHASSVMRRLGAIATSCLRHSGDVSDTDPHRKDPCVHVIENGFPFFNWFSEKPVSPVKPKPSKQTTRRIRLGRRLGVFQRAAVRGLSSSWCWRLRTPPHGRSWASIPKGWMDRTWTTGAPWGACLGALPPGVVP